MKLFIPIASLFFSPGIAGRFSTQFNIQNSSGITEDGVVFIDGGSSGSGIQYFNGDGTSSHDSKFYTKCSVPADETLPQLGGACFARVLEDENKKEKGPYQWAKCQPVYYNTDDSKKWTTSMMPYYIARMKELKDDPKTSKAFEAWQKLALLKYPSKTIETKEEIIETNENNEIILEEGKETSAIGPVQPLPGSILVTKMLAKINAEEPKDKIEAWKNLVAKQTKEINKATGLLHQAALQNNKTHEADAWWGRLTALGQRFGKNYEDSLFVQNMLAQVASARKGPKKEINIKNKGKVPMLATAGMRVVSKPANTMFWSAVCDKTLGSDKQYKMAPEGPLCGTIPGTKEAWFELIADRVHQVIQKKSIDTMIMKASDPIVGDMKFEDFKLENDILSKKATYALMVSMGGASAQIAIPIPKGYSKYDAIITTLQEGKVYLKDDPQAAGTCKGIKLESGDPMPWFGDHCSTDFLRYVPFETDEGPNSDVVKTITKIENKELRKVFVSFLKHEVGGFVLISFLNLGKTDDLINFDAKKEDEIFGVSGGGNQVNTMMDARAKDRELSCAGKGGIVGVECAQELEELLSKDALWQIVKKLFKNHNFADQQTVRFVTPASSWRKMRTPPPKGQDASQGFTEFQDVVKKNASAQKGMQANSQTTATFLESVMVKIRADMRMFRERIEEQAKSHSAETEKDADNGLNALYQAAIKAAVEKGVVAQTNAAKDKVDNAKKSAEQVATVRNMVDEWCKQGGELDGIPFGHENGNTCIKAKYLLSYIDLVAGKGTVFAHEKVEWANAAAMMSDTAFETLSTFKTCPTHKGN